MRVFLRARAFMAAECNTLEAFDTREEGLPSRKVWNEADKVEGGLCFINVSCRAMADLASWCCRCCIKCSI